MASTSALPKQNPALRRTVTSTTVTDSESAAVSPSDSPRHSASSTSLSSMSEVDIAKPKSEYGVMLDTYGNQFEVPDFTIKDIYNAIPKHCFKRSALKGYGYILRDIVLLTTTFSIWYNFVTPEYIPSTPARAGLWAVYTVLQGLFGTGLWVIAHECGHGAFSDSRLINDITGWVLHSSLLVPYFSWQISHRKHHKATGNMERDMVFVPKTREVFATRTGAAIHEMHELLEETPVYTTLHMIGQQLGGWPMYLFFNVTGHNNHSKQTEGKGEGRYNGFGGGVSHFFTASPLYERKDEKLILLSDLGLAITLSVLTLVGKIYGFQAVFVWYIVPWFWVHHWLVAITYLQHTDPSLPHYSGETWNFARGAAATIDREFGFIGRQIFHGIIETHVLHHYISTIPFYHADEATEAIKPVMGKHYRADVEDGSWGFIRAIYKTARWCQWVESNEGAEGDNANVLFYRNRNGHGVPPKKIAPSTAPKEELPAHLQRQWYEL